MIVIGDTIMLKVAMKDSDKEIRSVVAFMEHTIVQVLNTKCTKVKMIRYFKL